MKIYVGNASSHEDMKILNDKGLARLVTADHWRNPHKDYPNLPWALDNGAYSTYSSWQKQCKAARARRHPEPPRPAFDGQQFLQATANALEHTTEGNQAPDFVVLPDIVAGGRPSLRLSRAALQVLPEDFNYYLAVQDGLRARCLDENFWDPLEQEGGKLREFIWGVFVGGSLEWKLREGDYWVKQAHDRGLQCHIGRVGTFRRLAWAHRIQADSVDSSTFVMARMHGAPEYGRISAAANQTRLTMEANP